MKVIVDVVGLAITWRDILIGSCHYLDRVFFILNDINFNLFQLFAQITSKLFKYLSDSLLATADTYQLLD